MFIFLPLTCVYYPVAVLPDWLQVLAWAPGLFNAIY
jgi:ABC-2 type transport system permease protein